MEQYQRVQGAVGVSLQRLQEAYPELKSQTNYTTLMSQLEGTENRITIARRDYNGAVQAYNTKIRTFPDAVGAKIFYGAKPMVPFAATTPGAETAPTVNFGNAS
jgi:LemA protein